MKPTLPLALPLTPNPNQVTISMGPTLTNPAPNSNPTVTLALPLAPGQELDEEPDE